MDTTSLTKRLKIEIDGWPSLGGLEASKEDIRNIKEILGSKQDIIKVFLLYNTSLIHNYLFFTNYAIYIRDIRHKTRDIIRWWEITKVSYENEHFMFFNSEGKNFKNINVRTFFPKEISISTGVCFSEGLTSVASIAPNPLQLAQENKYSEAIEAVNYYITIESIFVFTTDYYSIFYR